MLISAVHDEPVSRTGIEVQMQRTGMWTQEGRRGWDKLRHQH